MRKKFVDKIKSVKGELLPSLSDQDLACESVMVYSKSEKYFNSNSSEEYELVIFSVSSKNSSFGELSEIDSLPEVRKSHRVNDLPPRPQLIVGSSMLDSKGNDSVEFREPMTKAEQKLLDASFQKNIKTHSVRRLEVNLNLSRKIRDKYLRFSKRDKAVGNVIHMKRHLKKARIFGKILARYQERLEERKLNRTAQLKSSS